MEEIANQLRDLKLQHLKAQKIAKEERIRSFEAQKHHQQYYLRPVRLTHGAHGTITLTLDARRMLRRCLDALAVEPTPGRHC